MKHFTNLSTAGNEKALRRGIRVPDGDVNIAYVDAPPLNPEENMIIVDTSNVVPENSGERAKTCRLFVANQLGILEDYETHDSVVREEYPVVGDVFSVDEDFDIKPGSEYKPSDALPFLHVSRFFHVDLPGLAAPNMFTSIDDANQDIKVVDERGREYVNVDGQRRYRVVLTEAPYVAQNYNGTQTAYRIFVYVDKELNEGLYLRYNKVELTTDHYIKQQDINHKEILNPRKYFDYVPEEAEVQDFVNRNRKIYSTKPIRAKSRIIGKDVSGKDGYQIHVPKKALPDTRKFQLFRWRIACDFTEEIKVDTARSAKTVKAGVVVTGRVKDDCTAYTFFNLEHSDYNAGGLTFVNPITEKLRDGDDTWDRETGREAKDYWLVDFDTVTYSELQEFDILIWHPGPRSEIDITPYLPKIKYFTEVCGGTLILEQGTHVQITGLDVTTTAPVNAVDGLKIAPGGDGYALYPDLYVKDSVKSTPLFTGEGFGGWNFDDGSGDEYNTLHPGKLGLMTYWALGDGKTNYISQYDANVWDPVISIRKGNEVFEKVIVHDITDGGYLYYSAGIIGISVLEDPTSGQRVTWNRGETIYNGIPFAEYKECVSSWTIEGVYKLLYNICLQALQKRVINDNDETEMGSSWTLRTEWSPSWVIKGDVLTGSERNKYDFVYHSKSLDDPELVQVRLLDPFKTVRELFEESQSPETLDKVAGMERTYRIETTNENVQTVSSSDIVARDGDIRPYAWTEVYSPPFTVPPELGPHIVEDEPIMAGYADVQERVVVYPDKPYGLYCSATSILTSQNTTTYDISWEVAGTANKVQFKTIRDELTWAADGGNGWYQHPDNGLIGAAGMGVHDPKGIDVVSYANYYFWALPIYANFGIHKTLTIGAYGEEVSFLQQAIKYFQAEGWVTLTGALAVDGVFGPSTKRAVEEFQTQMGCRSTNGFVDAETWSAIGMQTVRLDRVWRQNFGYPVLAKPPGFGDWHKWFAEVRRKMSRTHISDGDNRNVYMEQSNIVGSPHYVWDLFQVSVSDVRRLIAVDVIPYTEGFTKTVRVEAVDIHNRNTQGQDHTPFQGGMIGNYNVNDMRVKPRKYVKDGDTFHCRVGPWLGDTATVLIGQDGPSGWGTSRILGIRDIRLHVEELSLKSEQINIIASGTATVTTGQDLIIDLKPDYDGEGCLKDIVWGDITINPSDASENLHTEIVDDGKKLLIRNLDVHNNANANVFHGYPLASLNYLSDLALNPGTYSETPFYSMNENRRINPGREFGWINKTDGLKLFCDGNGKPFGFPPMPRPTITDRTLNELQFHYTLLYLNPINCDPSVMIGFYDVIAQEFIVDNAGQPRMSYIEYLKRGPENVYIAAISSYEETVVKDISSSSGEEMPFKWAKPIYGVCFKSGSQIGLEKPSSGLGPQDMWPIQVRTGKFTRDITLPSNLDQPTTGWYKDYAGRRLVAFYDVPEAETAGWSHIFGRPYRDVKDETPKLITDKVLQVRQPPIHMEKFPSVIPNTADPVLPIFTVYKRNSVTDAWEEVPWGDIEDYNVSNGKIVLASPLGNLDANNVKVNYTSARGRYNLKVADSQVIDLNPYPGHRRDLIGKTIYVYVRPEYVEDYETGQVISDSIRSKTLSITLDNDIFDPLSPTYDPLAVQLGIIFMSTSQDISKLNIMDTRRRGGGARDGSTLDELVQILQEANSYWDFNPSAGLGYPSGGFVLIRLPEALKLQFPNKKDIMEIIDRNITVGTAYKIETLDGKEWT